MSELWESMIIRERRQEAARRNISVAAVEEDEVLLQAVKESLLCTRNTDKGASFSATTTPIKATAHTLLPDLTVYEQDNDDNIYDDYIDTPIITNTIAQAITKPVETGTVTDADVDEEAISYNSIWYKLPTEISQVILLQLLCVDTTAMLHIVAKNNPFQPTEIIYKALCQHIYLKQSNKKTLLVNKFQNSYYYMVSNRSRIRTNGFYTLRTTYTKPPCNDVFWEDRRVECIETKYYRHLRFINNNKVLYNQDIIDDIDIKAILVKPVSKKVYIGDYTLVGRKLVVTIELHYCVMYYHFNILDGCDGYDEGYCGKFNLIRLIEHSALPHVYSNNNTAGASTALIQFPIPQNCDFRFSRVWEWV